ncbi:MAG: galactose mutarotase [Chitinophagaceae bacterium]|nr:galactose mutarotase [Chitinophagaceae bacterium]
MSGLSGNNGAGPIRKESWGNTNGEDVWLYTLENSRGMRLKVSNYGAILHSLIVPDKNGHEKNVVLTYDTLEDYIADPSYIGAVVGRYANRIGGANFNLNGKNYPLSKNLGATCLHGGTFGFNKKIFQTSIINEGHEPGIRFTYLSPDGEEGFPGNLSLQVTYSLTENNEWVITYEAQTDHDTVINLTQHAYFNLTGNPDASVMDHQLAIYADDYLPSNQQQLPTGDIDPVSGTSFDFREVRVINQMLDENNLQIKYGSGFDHSWVLEKIATRRLKKAATLLEPGTGIQMDVFTTEPAVHFYSGNFLGHNTGPEFKKVFTRRTALCLETQHFPDSPHHPHFPSTVLRPGEIFTSKTVFQFQ